MAITRFSSTDYKGIKHAECAELRPLMVIAGPNGVGKSTLLQLLSFELRGEGADGVDVKFEPRSIAIYFGAHRAPQHLQVYKYTPLELRENKRAVQWDYFNRMGNSFLGLDTTVQAIPETIRQNSWRTATSADYAPYFEVKRTLIELESQLREIVYDTYKKNGEITKGQFFDLINPLNEVISHFLPYLQFKEIALDEKGYFRINFTNKEGQIIEFDYLSSGEKEIISFFFPIIYYKIIKQIKLLSNEPIRPLDLVFVIDSPEEHLHPSLQLSFIRYIKNLLVSPDLDNLKIQFIICTHSHFIINESTDHVFIMNHPKADGSNQLIESKELKNDELDLLLGNLGLVAISTGKPIILVEGSMDVDILSIFFESINKQCTLLPMSGKGQIYNIMESLNSIIQELDKEGVKLFAIVDKDRSENTVSGLGRIHVLPVSCMENFLLTDFDCIYEGLKIAVGQNRLNHIQSGKDVDALLEQLIHSSNLKNLEIKSRLNEQLSFRISTERGSLTEKEIMSELENVYNAKRARLPKLINNVTLMVDGYVNEKNYRELNGKNIIRGLAAHFNVNGEALTRAIASSMMKKRGGGPPFGLTTILKAIIPLH